MKAQELKHKARLAEWKEKVGECRSSGETVKGWCQARGIAIKTYYYWEKEVLAEAEKAKDLAVGERRGGVNFAAVPALPEQSHQTEAYPAVAAKVRKGDVEVEIYVGAEAGTIEVLLRALKDAE